MGKMNNASNSKNSQNENTQNSDTSQTEYQSSSELKGKKGPYQRIYFLEKWLSDHFEFRRNVVWECVEVKKKDSALSEWVRLEDQHVKEMCRQLMKLGHDFAENKIDMVLNSDFVPKFHPFKSYFESLVYNGSCTEILNFASRFKVSENQIALTADYFSRWLVAAVGCAIEEQVNHLLMVIAGPQGIGKSTMIDTMVPDELKKYNYTGNIDPKDKDAKTAISENLIVNLDELENSSTGEIGHLKSIITASQVNIRRPYAKYSIILKRRASFIASVNRSAFLSDDTGNRRFLIIDAQTIDYKTPLDVDQLWAEAYYLYKRGDFKHYFDSSDIYLVNEQNARFQISTPEAELLLKHFEPQSVANYTKDDLDQLLKCKSLEYMSATEIAANLMDQYKSFKLSVNKLGTLLKRSGFVQEHRKINGQSVRLYLVKRTQSSDEINAIHFDG